MTSQWIISVSFCTVKLKLLRLSLSKTFCFLFSVLRYAERSFLSNWISLYFVMPSSCCWADWHRAVFFAEIILPCCPCWTSASVLRCFWVLAGWRTLALYCAFPCNLLCFSSCFALSRSQSYLFLDASGGWLADAPLLCTVPFLVLYCASPHASPCLGRSPLVALPCCYALLPAVGFAFLGSFHPFSPARRWALLCERIIASMFFSLFS